MKSNAQLLNEGASIICGIKAECLNHICQDDLSFTHFVDNEGSHVWAGAVSDGCSGALGSEHGSTFLVQTFIEEVRRLGKDKKRDNNFLLQVILALTERMTEYEPKNSGSALLNYNGIRVSNELVATLYGFVADKNQVLIVAAGDGFIAINGHEVTIDQPGGDLYPIFLLRFSPNLWKKKMESIFTFAEFPANRINNLVIGTDGFHHPKPSDFPDITKNPAMFVLQAQFHATKNDTDGIPGANSSRGGDDATALIFANTNFQATNPLGADAVTELCNQLNHHTSGNYRESLEKIPHTIIRPCIMTEDEVTSSSTFIRVISTFEGISLYGITQEDVNEYSKQSSQIIKSRISHADDSNPLSFLSKNKQLVKTISDIPTVKGGRQHIQATPSLKSDKKINTPTMQKTMIVPILAIQESAENLIEKPSENNNALSQKFSFSDLCQPNYRKHHKIGFRHFGRVMFDLWHFVSDCHAQKLRIGNLRPQDLSVEIVHDTKLETYRFSLVNPDSTAKVDENGNLLKEYSELDKSFVHPEYADDLVFDDKVRIDQDWYAYSVLCYWFVTKYDPFGEGIVKAKPDADRIYRMQNDLIITSSNKISLGENMQKFIKRAVNRLNRKVKEFIENFIERDFFGQSPKFLLTEFNEEKIIICPNSKDRVNRKKGKIIVPCAFKQIMRDGTCAYCAKPLLKSISFNDSLV